MTDNPPSDRKSELLDAAVEYLVRHGAADTSLRPLAAAIGTSARLLIFHFTSKERLLGEVLTEIQRRLRVSLATLGSAPEGARPTSPMLRFWAWATARENLPYLRLLYEVHFITLQNPRAFGPRVHKVSAEWMPLVEARLPPPLRDRATATLCIAVFDGLMIELLGTRDLARTTESMERFVDMLRLAAGDAEARTKRAKRAAR
jgi:AcrR family transcriptional regulator